MKKHVALLLALITLVLIIIPLPPPAEAAVTLELGSRGENVRKVQERLIKFDYLKGKADGIYGRDTYNAVKLFQSRNKLTADGRVGPATAAKLGVTLTSSSGSTAASSTSSDVMLLARLVHSEARGESYKGKVAVAAVVLNRVKSSKFPNTIAAVIYQKGAFSVVANGKINLTPNAEAIRAAKEAMNGWDPTGGCLYFFNKKLTNDAFLKTRTVRTVIGNHSFAA